MTHTVCTPLVAYYKGKKAEENVFTEEILVNEKDIIFMFEIRKYIIQMLLNAKCFVYLYII